MRKIAFVCPEPGITGGFNVIFRHAMEPAHGGVTVTIVCKTPITAAHIGWHRSRRWRTTRSCSGSTHNEAPSHCFDLATATW